MSRPQTYSYSMTLRLSTTMETDLEDLAYTLRTSKAATIRRALRIAITRARQNEIQICNGESRGGSL